MAKIDPPLLPPRLYRYRNVSSMDLVEQELRAISNDYVWCSQYRELNDPMEGFYGVSPWLKKQTKFTRLTSEILSQKRSVGICCFSDTYDNELMWAHYAGNYSGICVAYSTRQLREGLGDHVHIVRIAYGGSPPRIGRDDSVHADHAARTILSHKKSCWLYEREWRLLTSSNATQVPGQLKITTVGAVKAVYLGLNMNECVKDKLVDELTRLKIPTKTLRVPGYGHKWQQT